MLYAAGDARFEDHPVPQIEDPFDVILRIGFVGVCGSDVSVNRVLIVSLEAYMLMVVLAGPFLNPWRSKPQSSTGPPQVMGHEASGTVYSIGSAVTKLKPGDRVAIEPGVPCRRCRERKHGLYNCCENMRFAAAPGPGEVTHGCLTKLYKCQEDFCYKLPDHVGLDEGALVEPLAVAVQAAKQIGIRPGQTAVVFGSGTIGLLCCAVAREFGAGSIIAVDINEDRLRFAKSFAATGVYRSDASSSAAANAEKIRELFDLGAGADVIIEASGAEPSIQAGIQVCRKGGSYIQVGLGKPIVAFPITEMSERGMTMKGVFRYGPGAFELAVDFLRRKRIDVKQLITQRVDFEQTVEAWEITKSGSGIKTLIRGVVDQTD